MYLPHIMQQITWLFMATYFALPHSIAGSSISKRDAEYKVPLNWRNLIDPDVYQYSQAKKDASIAADRFEGDISGIDFDPSTNTKDLAANAVNDDRLWPNAIIPYTINEDEFTSTDIQLIERAIRGMVAETCLKFPPRTNEKYYVTFTKGTNGCTSYVGNLHGHQMISLHSSCLTLIGEIQHEIMHAIGFQHEQSRIDRDQYVHVIFDNIPTSLHNQFAKYRGRTFDLPYDYNSIMHFAHNTFSKDPENLPTILPNGQAPIGNRKRDDPIINPVKRPTTPIPSSGKTGKKSQRETSRCPVSAKGLDISSCNSSEDCKVDGLGTKCCTFCKGSVCNNYCAN
ncbi:putative Zinc metalloproteinase nas-15 [Hypsibius exemplaris]|uniref:Metalloendopeptidase n=1 Tax=Hypsibius exemplaris TaxID=2072580 RepID=A0A9X6NDW0_HYPEX|nr:putative Zinc metalloproteinase nas-15 [Hypsibius exemplaris]